ncbi:MAG: hypothetical protein JWO58_1847 [Chitinophagaceae bacterium]|nr:hypothetical protein [Chitinophagaceae bacterium]
MVKIIRHFLLLFATLFVFQCNFEKQIDIKLPDYANTPYVECYLEPGKPFRLLAYYSLDYFGPLVPTPIRDAEVTITHRGVSILLPYDTIPRISDIRFYNYRSKDTSLVPAHYNEVFDLSIKINGVTYTSTTTILPAVAIDSLYSSCNDKQRCDLGIRFKDQVNTRDYYRYITFSDSLGGDVKQDYVISDALFDSEDAQVIGGHSFNEGQSVVVYLYHLTKEHYDFLSSVKDAQEANGNPFAQPSSIKSNIPGILGIFTGLTSDNKTVANIE